MIVISHRGYWKTADEKNTEAAFRRSFACGFGTETDVRDIAGQLVISHDPPNLGALTVDKFLRLHAELGRTLPLALNIKSDGLHGALAALVARHGLRDWFAFDMSVPDLVGYRHRGLPFFTRHSDYEPHPSLYVSAAGVWLDAFESDWFGTTEIGRHLDAGKRVCVVSPELHRRDHEPVWKRLKDSPYLASKDLLICTDHPEEARAYFQ